MTARGGNLLGQADLASLGQASGLARPVLHWERRDLLRELPPGVFDLVLCRNVVIYFEQAVYAKLAAALRPGGVLLLGTCERLLAPGRLGLAVAGAHVYRKAPA